MIRLLREVKEKPMYILFENVAAIFNNTHRPILNIFKQDLEELGYTLYNDLLNAKDYGIPQNRNRYFLVAILGKYNYKFPKPVKLELRLKDMLEDEVDEKYYLGNKMIEYITNTNEKWTGNNGESLVNKKIASTINTGEGSRRCDASNYIVDAIEDEFDLKLHIGGGVVIKTNLNIRKLTPKECYRLMGFQDEAFERAAKVISNSQLYKTAGNSIVVKVLERIFTNLFMLEEEQ
jgi:DNA (cytosine-5)-methyltransferase 1